MSNVATHTIPANKKTKITCVSNAAYYQKVLVGLSQTQGTMVVGGATAFFGNGENVPMEQAGGKVINLPDDLPEFKSDLPIDVSLSFFYNPNKPKDVNDYQPLDKIRPSGSGSGGTGQPTINTFNFGSEDGTDNDYNDSILTIEEIG
jgi:hypothetical protein